MGGNFEAMRRLLPYVFLGLVLVSLDTPAFAYLDGATGSMMVQAIIGSVAAAGVFGRHALAKTKAALVRIFRSPTSGDR